jgi:hypothetical protein
MSSRHPRPLAHRLAAFGIAGLFSLGVLGATFRDSTRTLLRSAALPLFARMSTAGPGTDWEGVDEATRYAAERANAAAELARARAEADRAKADLARLAARQTRERVRLAQARRREPSASVATTSAKAWAGPATFTFVAPQPPAELRVHEQVDEALGRTERTAARVALVTGVVPGGCAHGREALAALAADQRRLAVLADLPRRLAGTVEPDGLTPQQADSIAKYVVAHLDTAALRTVRVGSARSCG